MAPRVLGEDDNFRGTMIVSDTPDFATYKALVTNRHTGADDRTMLTAWFVDRGIAGDTVAGKYVGVVAVRRESAEDCKSSVAAAGVEQFLYLEGIPIRVYRLEIALNVRGVRGVCVGGVGWGKRP